MPSWGADYELSELDLLLEVMQITRAQPEQTPKQEQQVGDKIAVDEVPCKEKEKTIGAENRFKPGEVTFNKQEVTIGTGNVVMATRAPGGVILKVHKRKRKVLKSDPKPDPKSDIKKPDLKSNLKSDLTSSKPVEVATELVRWAKRVENDPGPSFHHICQDSPWGENPFKKHISPSFHEIMITKCLVLGSVLKVTG
jgi:hypothetical protein